MRPLFLALLAAPFSLSLVGEAGARPTPQSSPPAPLVLDAQPTALAFAPGGKSIAAGLAAGEVRLWDTAGKPAHTLTGHSVPVTVLAFSPDGKLLASAGYSADGKGAFELRLWDTVRGEAVHSVREEAHRSAGDGLAPIAFLAFSPDGSLLALPGKDRTVRVWDVKARQERRSWKLGLVPSAAAFSPDGKRLAVGTHTGTSHGTVTVFDVAAEGKAHELWAIYSGMLKLAWSPDGKQVSAGFRHMALRRDAQAKDRSREGTELWASPRPEKADALAFSAGGRLLAVRVGDRLTVVDTRSGAKALDSRGAAGPVALAADGRRVAAGSAGGKLKVWGIP